jgi:hypothetical protein
MRRTMMYRYVAMGDSMTQTEQSTVPSQTRRDVATAVEQVDPRDVCRAFRLGWSVAEYHREIVAPAAPAAADASAPVGGLPVAGRLDRADLLRAGAAQVRVDFVALHLERTVGPSGLAVPNVRKVLDQEEFAEVEPEKAAGLLRILHVDLLTSLLTVEPALGNAYDLGASLAMFCAPTGGPSATLQADPDELLRLHDLVRDLTSVLPPHAGHGVSVSMARWHAYLFQDLRTRYHRTDPSDKQLLLVRQGQQWRALLSGEKNPQDDLSIDEFIEAGLASLDRGQRELFRVLRVIWPVLAVLALAAATVLVITLSATSGTAESTTALTTIAATLVAAWRAVKAPMGHAFTGIEDRLRGGEIDAAIAESITVLPADAKSRKVRAAAEKVMRVQGD